MCRICKTMFIMVHFLFCPLGRCWIPMTEMMTCLDAHSCYQTKYHAIVDGIFWGLCTCPPGKELNITQRIHIP